MASPPPYCPGPSSAHDHLRRGGHNQNGYGSVDDNRHATRKESQHVISLWLTILMLSAFVAAISVFATSQVMHEYRRREIDSLNRELKNKDAWVADEKRKIWAWAADEKQKIHDQEEELQHEKERLGLDAERITRSNVHWGPLKWDEACVSWKKMRYSAELEMLPQDVDGMAWCHAMSIDIFGTTFKEPDYCEKTLDGRVIGHWTRTDEPHCNTYWGNKQDRGCQPGVPGYRRIRMRLLGHQQPWKETWFALCETTPWPGHGTPENCENAGRGGIWGEWRVRDNECQEQ